ncbi:DUF4260 domain-containing protein [Enterovibrio paralichthyis]|uniref:DUF4260 domain-containing protein n=1 Tax=Enterovibrio paralichthyis TaxID=2853805 RepID=UPI001C48DC38|nr:DUF4260 domain-containing protein [Enterovibrio paralichthyis]MBV7298407.1 DUF4260 domain-containing protein [Enterovibrio paralichthyis]
MTGAAQGNVRNVLRLEGLGLFLAALALYHQQGFAWSMFFTWILLPDIALLAFLASPRIGAIAYNITHSSIGPFLLIVLAAFMPFPAALPICLIWFAHIGFDRALGYGLKYQQGFSFTHLGRIGKQK